MNVNLEALKLVIQKYQHNPNLKDEDLLQKAEAYANFINKGSSDNSDVNPKTPTGRSPGQS